jgi:hypothetical protein
MVPIGDRRTFQKLPGGGYIYKLVDDGVAIEVRYLRRIAGQLHAELDVRCEWAGAQHRDGRLSCADLNLSSQPARRGLAKYCAERARTKPNDFDWMGVIDAACIETIQADRQGDDVIVLDDAPIIANREIDILPGFSLPFDAASLLIAHGDSLKSMIVLYVLGALAQLGHVVLLLDWEWTADRHRARKERLFGTTRLDGLHYLRCRAPLVLEADRIRRYCETHKVAFIGVDSIGLACDGKLTDDDVAIRFHRALATLPSSLCAVHVPKSSLNPEAKAEPDAFGSVFFTNLCRMSWTVKKQPGATEDLVTVGLFPKKQNDGDRRKPAGLQFSFTPGHIDVRPVDLVTVDGLAEKMPLNTRMTHLLQRGPMTFAQIAEELGAKVDSVIKAANRSAAFTKVQSADGVQRIALVERRTA